MTRRARNIWISAASTLVAGAARVYATRRYFQRSPGPRQFMHEDPRLAWTPSWYETLTGMQWLRLHRSAVYRGDGVPRGDEAPVLLVHGFLSRPIYLETLRHWLARLGYRPHVANLGWNADCYDVLADRLTSELAALFGRTRRRVHLVGHSLGGILVRAVAAREPDWVASVATLATPFRGLRVHPALRVSNVLVRAVVHARRDPSVFPECMTLACPCATVRALATPLPAHIPQLAVVAIRDGLTDWRYQADPATMRVAEVPTSHFGSVYDPAVYEALAEHLASAAHARHAVS
jgi:pimeloyl-ACP methyl ester carboxylesterase